MKNIGKRNTQHFESTRVVPMACAEGCNVMCGGLCNCDKGVAGLSVSDRDSNGMNAYHGRNYVAF